MGLRRSHIMAGRRGGRSAAPQVSGTASFGEALAALGVALPAYHPAALGKAAEGEAGYVASATWQVNVELLPLLGHSNARIAVHAAARIHQIAMCLVGAQRGEAPWDVPAPAPVRRCPLRAARPSRVLLLRRRPTPRPASC